MAKTTKKNETPTEQIKRVAEQFALTHDLGMVGGWFDQECAKFNPLGVAWFTALIIVELTALDAKDKPAYSHVAAFVLELDSM